MVSEMKDCLQEELTLLESSMEKIIREAAKIMLEADAHRLNVKQKAGTANFVTEYDVRVQRCLEAAFTELLPGCSFLAEEEGEGENPIGSGYTFVIDPIDGTTNFMLGRRASAISVGLFKDGAPLCAAVYDPYADRYFSAAAGKGAYCNHKPIHVSTREPAVAIISLGTAPYYSETMARPVAEITYGLLTTFGDIRRVGSAAMDLCEVACGELDGFVEPILSPWDFAAGMLIVAEAGGIVTDFKGCALTGDKPGSVLAASPNTYDKIRGVVKDSI